MADSIGALAESPTLAIAATFTAEPLQESLEFWLRELSLPYRIRFALYNQIFQTLLDPAGLFASNRGGLNAVLVRLEDWARHTDDTSAETLEGDVTQFISSVRSAAPQFGAALLIVLCPASLDIIEDVQRTQALHAMEELIAAELEAIGNVYVARSGEVASLYPVGEYYDRAGDELGHVPYTPEFFAALATFLARRVHALHTAPFKVLVLDCDNTLWSGICGEDGPEGVRIGLGRRALQEFALTQRESGMLLAICSKNNEEDVVETFAKHPEMLLKLGDFTARRVNWDPKSSNLRALAEELDLALDSFILIDDDPKECAEIEANCPGVLALPLPAETEIEHFLRHVWAFDRVKVTSEDRERASHYEQRGERRQFERQAASLEEFLAGLQLEVRIARPEAHELARAAQLTQRTNQMNCTLVRRSEPELQHALESGQTEALVAEASDRFGAYGLVGLMLYRPNGEALAVDTFLMSCRAFGRGIEHQMLAELGRIAATQGLRYVDILLVRGPRNKPAVSFLESAGAAVKNAAPGGLLYRFESAGLAHLQYHPSSAQPATEISSRDGAEPGARGRPVIPYARIAAELSRPEQVIAAMHARRKAAASHSQQALTEPHTGTEKRLAAIWEQILGVANVGLHDNFFDLGGHSLLAVQLLSRLREEFAVDLSLEVVYSGTLTVAELAKTIELFEIGQADAGEYAAILAELDTLSDEEVRAILAQEAAGGSRCGSS